MKRLIETRTVDGGTLLVEVDEPEAPEGQRPVDRPVTRGLAPGAVSERAQLNFEEALKAVSPTAERLVASLREMTDAPNQITLSFGLSLRAGVGVVLASTEVTANFGVSMTWMRFPPGMMPPPH